MSLIKTRGIILKIREYKEKDNLIYIFSGTEGKITVMARGVRSAKGRNQAAVQPMTLCDFVLYSGKNIHGLNEAFVVHSFNTVKSDYDRIAYGSYFLELADIALADREPNERYFLDLIKAMYLLDEKDIDPVQLARAFEIKTLVRTGNLPDPALAEGMTASARHLVWFMLNKPLEDAVNEEASEEDLMAVKELAGGILKECFRWRPKSLDVLEQEY